MALVIGKRYFFAFHGMEYPCKVMPASSVQTGIERA
jgi:hypothetical protein